MLVDRDFPEAQVLPNRPAEIDACHKCGLRGHLEVTVNVEALKQLTRVLSSVPSSAFGINDWKTCACGHATRDPWFQEQGFTHCHDFRTAAAFFGIRQQEAVALFSAPRWTVVTPQTVIQRIRALIEQGSASAKPMAEGRDIHARRQAVIDGLLTSANNAARRARRAVTTLVAAFF